MSYLSGSAAGFAAVLIVFAAAGCGSGGSVTPAARDVNDASAATGARDVTPAWKALVGPISVVGYGGLKGITFGAHADGDTYDYGEDVTIDFDRAVDMPSVLGSVAVSPAAPWLANNTNFGKRVALTLRKTPGVTYTIALHAGLRAQNGTALAADIAYHITTPATVVLPTRPHSAKGQAYRYGFLVHPTSDSMAGPNATRIADMLAAAGTRFVRIDYTGDQVMPTPTTTNFGPSDKIVALLKARNITLMPLLVQYWPAAWQSLGAPYPAIYATPDLYAQYVGTVVAHLAATAPQITRIELFNEPNLRSWWVSPSATYTATDGSATAAYMQAAYAAAKAANPAIVVVGPSLADGGGSTVDPRTFLTTMYAAGCRTGVCWDVLSIHPYAWIDPTYTVASTLSTRWQIYKDLQAIAVANGDPMPHVMLTEWSYSTVNEANGFDPNVQARYLAAGLNLSLRDPTVDGIVWTSLYNTGSDFWARTAVTDPSFNELPALAAFRAFAVP